MSVDVGTGPKRMGTRKHPIEFGRNVNFIGTARSDDSGRMV